MDEVASAQGFSGRFAFFSAERSQQTYPSFPPGRQQENVSCVKLEELQRVKGSLGKYFSGSLSTFLASLGTFVYLLSHPGKLAKLPRDHLNPKQP